MVRQTQISIVSGVVLLLIILLLGINHLASLRANQSTKILKSYAVPTIDALHELRFGIARIVSSTNELLVLSASRDAQRTDEAFEHERRELEHAGFWIYEQAFERLKRYHENAPIEDEQTLVPYLDELDKRYWILKAAAIELDQLSNEPFDAVRIEPLRESFENKEQDVLEAINELYKVEHALSWQMIEEAVDSVDWMGVQADTIGAMSICILLIYSLFIIRALAGEAKARLAVELSNDALEQTKAELEFKNRELHQHRGNLEKLVSERTQAVEVEKEKAESADRAKSIFLANMSHELRTPLNAILGFSALIGRDRDAPPSVQEKVAIINRSGDHLLGMINDVLELSKIELGSMELEPAEFDLPEMLEDIGFMFEVRAQVANLHFNRETDPRLAHYIKADIGKLRQILINLLGNAVKFTQKGNITLSVHTLPVADDPSMVTLQLEVADDGMGIPQEQQEHIFEPFVQIEEPHVGPSGTGLGLTIIRSLVELMGGRINVVSTPGEGSLFHVELTVPLAQGMVEKIGVDSAMLNVQGLEHGQTAWRILVVEDNDENRLLLTSQLLQAGFEVQQAGNGEEAVALFKEWQPHLIWMDMRMPVMDGYEATAKIRALPDGDQVKIIAVTASAFKEQRKDIIEAGCDEVIHKPYQIHEIFDAMAEQLGVRYRYEEPIEQPAGQIVEVSAEAVAALSQELRESLHHAARSLSNEEFDAALTQVRALDLGLAEGLALLAQNFRFDHILTLTETTGSEKSR